MEVRILEQVWMDMTHVMMNRVLQRVTLMRRKIKDYQINSPGQRWSSLQRGRYIIEVSRYQVGRSDM